MKSFSEIFRINMSASKKELFDGGEGANWHQTEEEEGSAVVSILFPNQPNTEHVMEDNSIFEDKYYECIYKNHKLVLEFRQIIGPNDSYSGDNIRRKFKNGEHERNYKAFRTNGVFFLEHDENSHVCGVPPNVWTALWIGRYWAQGYEYAKVREFYFEDGLIVGSLSAMSKTKIGFDDEIYKKFAGSFNCQLMNKK